MEGLTVTEPLVIDGVTKRFGTVVAVDDVDLVVEPGTVHCLLGPNGSGKTTLLDVVLGLTGASSGTVSRGDASLGSGFQQATFYPDLTVAENLHLFAAADGDDAWRTEVRDALELDRVHDRRAGDLSGGWAKRLDLALAFLDRPDVVLLDEPLDDLDDVTRRSVLDLLAEYRTVGTVLVATHRVEAFEPIADRVTIMDRGRVVHDGPADEVDGSLERFYLDCVDGGA